MSAISGHATAAGQARNTAKTESDEADDLLTAAQANPNNVNALQGQLQEAEDCKDKAATAYNTASTEHGDAVSM